MAWADGGVLIWCRRECSGYGIALLLANHSIFRSTMSIDLNEFAPVINESLLRGRAAAVSYIDGDGFPAGSFRGSTQIHSATQPAI